MIIDDKSKEKADSFKTTPHIPLSLMALHEPWSVQCTETVAAHNDESDWDIWE